MLQISENTEFNANISARNLANYDQGFEWLSKQVKHDVGLSKVSTFCSFPQVITDLFQGNSFFPEAKSSD